MSISGTINQTTESAAYTYDDLGRLVTSNQTSNGSSAQRRFAYDRWGNRTGMWDAVSGGTQIQSITLQQAGGAPTNKIQSVTSGSTVNYIYDAAGNVTNDGAHSYTYDAENRIVSVDGGSTATYAYDQLNQRYKKVTSGASTYYIWQGSQVIAEHNGTTGVSVADYVYSGSRMIAKIAGLTTQYFLSDRLSERLVFGASGTVLGRMGHLPFGEDFGESGTQDKHHFTSYERDSESATDYAINRQFMPTVGSYTRPDSERGRIEKPQTQNRYLYVRDDPINFVDVEGMVASRLNGPHEAYLESSSDTVPEVPEKRIHQQSLTNSGLPDALADEASLQLSSDLGSDEGTQGVTNESSVGILVRTPQKFRVRARSLNPFTPVWFGVHFTGDPEGTKHTGYSSIATVVLFLWHVVANHTEPIGKRFWEHCLYHPDLERGGSCYQLSHSFRQFPTNLIHIDWVII